jgi:hypothetical protein
MSCLRLLFVMTCFVSGLIAAPLPNVKEANKKKIDLAVLWMQHPLPGNGVSGILTLCDLPEVDVLKHFKEQIKPLKLTEERAKELIAQLGSKNDDEAMQAFEELRVLDLRLAMKPTKAFDHAPQGVIRQRLTAALEMYGYDMDRYKWCKINFTTGAMKQLDGKFKLYTSLSLDNMPDKPVDFKTVFDTEFGGQKGMSASFQHEVKDVHCESWYRFARATFVLERMTHPDAKTLLEAMAEGHPEAFPTVYAKAALKRKQAKPLPFDINANWADLASDDDAKMTLAALTMRQHLDTVTPFLTKTLKPVSLSDKELKQHLTDLGSEDEAVAKKAIEALTLNDPRHFKSLAELDELPPNELSRSRLLELLRREKFDSWKGMNLVTSNFTENGCYLQTPKFLTAISSRAESDITALTTRSYIAVHLLSTDPSAEAKKLLETLAKGHSKARLTLVAKKALESRP